MVFRKPAGLVLAPDLGAAYVDVKHATRSLDQGRVDVELFFDRFRQTGGCGIVVSLSTVFDADLHGS